MNTDREAVFSLWCFRWLWVVRKLSERGLFSFLDWILWLYGIIKLQYITFNFNFIYLYGTFHIKSTVTQHASKQRKNKFMQYIVLNNLSNISRWWTLSGKLCLYFVISLLYFPDTLSNCLKSKDALTTIYFDPFLSSHNTSDLLMTF